MHTFLSTTAFTVVGTYLDSRKETYESIQESSYIVDSNGYSTGKYKAFDASNVYSRERSLQNENGFNSSGITHDSYLGLMSAFSTYGTGIPYLSYIAIGGQSARATKVSKGYFSSSNYQYPDTINNSSFSTSWTFVSTYSTGTYSTTATRSSYDTGTVARSFASYYSTLLTSSTTSTATSSTTTTTSSVATESYVATSNGTAAATVTVTSYTTGPLLESAQRATVVAAAASERLFYFSRTSSSNIGLLSELGNEFTTAGLSPYNGRPQLNGSSAVVSSTYTVTQTATVVLGEFPFPATIYSTGYTMTTTTEVTGSFSSYVYDGIWPATQTTSASAWQLTTTTTSFTGATTTTFTKTIGGATQTVGEWYSVWSSVALTVTINGPAGDSQTATYAQAFTTTASFAQYLSKVTAYSWSSTYTSGQVTLVSTTGTSNTRTSLSTWSGYVAGTTTYTTYEIITFSTNTDVCNVNTVSTQTTSSSWFDGTVTYQYKDSTFHTSNPSSFSSFVSSATFLLLTYTATSSYLDTNYGTDVSGASTLWVYSSTIGYPATYGTVATGYTSSLGEGTECGYSYTWDQTIATLPIEDGVSSTTYRTILLHRITDHSYLYETITAAIVGSAMGSLVLSIETWLAFSGTSTIHTISRETWLSSTSSTTYNGQIAGSSTVTETTWSVTGTTSRTDFLGMTSRTFSEYVLLGYIGGASVVRRAYGEGVESPTRAANRWPNVTALIGLPRQGVHVPGLHALTDAVYENLSASTTFYFPFTTQGRRYTETVVDPGAEGITTRSTFGHFALMLPIESTTYSTGDSFYSASYRTSDSVMLMTTGSMFTTSTGTNTNTFWSASTTTQVLTISGVSAVSRRDYRAVPWARTTVQARIGSSDTTQQINVTDAGFLTDQSSSRTSGDPETVSYNGRDFSVVGGTPGETVTLLFAPGVYSFTYASGGTAGVTANLTSSFATTGVTTSALTGTFALAIPDRQESVYQDYKYKDTALITSIDFVPFTSSSAGFELTFIKPSCWPYTDPDDESRVFARQIVSVARYPCPD